MSVIRKRILRFLDRAETDRSLPEGGSVIRECVFLFLSGNRLRAVRTGTFSQTEK